MKCGTVVAPFVVWLGALVAVGPVAAGDARRPAPEAAGATEKAGHDVNALREKLAKVLNLDQELNGTLQDAVGFLSGQYDLNVVVNSEAFRNDLDIAEVQTQMVKVPRLKDIRLATLLTLLLDQVQGGYMVRSKFIEVVPLKRIRKEVGKAPEGTPAPEGKADDKGDKAKTAEEPQAPPLRLVHFVFTRRPLDQALQDVAEWAECDFAIDPRAEEKAKTPVSARLQNVPADTAVTVLADMADLKMVIVGNVYYVTTKENARALEREQKERRPRKKMPTAEP